MPEPEELPESAVPAARATPAAAPHRQADAWRTWDEHRLRVLRASFEADGWTVAERRRYSDSYELDLGEEGVAQASVPRNTEARDTDRRAAEAAHTLIVISGEPHLELGPLTEREAAWATLVGDAEQGAVSASAAADERLDDAAMSHVDRQARRPWAEIQADHKHIDAAGDRWVLGWDDSAGTVLAPWVGPAGPASTDRGPTSSYAPEDDGRRASARLAAYSRQSLPAARATEPDSNQRTTDDRPTHGA
jgi:hypothetical protein